MKKYYLSTGITLLLLIAVAYSCSKSEDFLEIENMFSNIDSQKNSITKGKKKYAIKNHFLNQTEFPGTTLLQEVFCYGEVLGNEGGSTGINSFVFLFPDRSSNTSNLNPNDVFVPSSGGGTPTDLTNFLNSNNKLTIRNQINNPCLNGVLEQILHDNNTKLMGVLGKYISYWKSASEDFTNITFIESRNLRSGRLAQWSGSLDNSIIELDINLLPYYSREKITTVILHEFLHRFFSGVEQNTTATQDHEHMITTYFNLFQPAILGLFPNLSEKEARALLISGLKETSYYNNLTQNTKDEYREINQDYSDVGSKGSRCN